MPLPLALCKVTPSYFQLQEEDAQIALHSVREISELIRYIVMYNLRAAAGRLMGLIPLLENKS